VWWEWAIGAAVAVVALWVLLAISLWVGARDSRRLTETLRLLPDILRLISRLARDKSLPPGARVRLWLLLAYLAMPIDLIPDFIPVIGYADDAIIVAVTIRSVVARAGRDTLERHWPGTPDGLAAVERLLR
jgi:uncharacterized membrane protein YkvA (DUF1232 family)